MYEICWMTSCLTRRIFVGPSIVQKGGLIFDFFYNLHESNVDIRCIRCKVRKINPLTSAKKKFLYINKILVCECLWIKNIKSENFFEKSLMDWQI